MTFIPYPNKIHIEPIEEKMVIKTQDSNLMEKGRVVAVGRDVAFVKVGDIIYFDSWGCSKTSDGYYVVADNGSVIHGKDESGA